MGVRVVVVTVVIAAFTIAIAVASTSVFLIGGLVVMPKRAFIIGSSIAVNKFVKIAIAHGMPGAPATVIMLTNALVVVVVMMIVIVMIVVITLVVPIIVVLVVVVVIVIVVVVVVVVIVIVKMTVIALVLMPGKMTMRIDFIVRVEIPSLAISFAITVTTARTTRPIITVNGRLGTAMFLEKEWIRCLGRIVPEILYKLIKESTETLSSRRHERAPRAMSQHAPRNDARRDVSRRHATGNSDTSAHCHRR